MRHARTIIVISALVVAGWAAAQWRSGDLLWRGGDPNVTTRSLNTSGLPAAGTSGRAGTAWSGDETFVARALEAHTTLADAAARVGKAGAPAADACRRDHLAARRELEDLARGKDWAVDTAVAAGSSSPHAIAGMIGDATAGALPAAARAAHEQALGAFAQAAEQASDAALRAWAERSASMMRDHIAAGAKGD
jgi:hypothetical protein